jgi:TonB-linked SusC/RagA family outer membrane protein
MKSVIWAGTPANYQFTVKGTITDANGLPVAGVHVLSKNTKQGVVSDFDGTYTLNVHPNDVLMFSALGFQSQTISVNHQTTIHVTLLEDVTQLGTVLLNAGYYSVKEKERTGNIAKLEAVTIEKQPVTNPMAAMQGHLSGVNVVQKTGVPGGGYTIEIRGKNFINGSTDPLFIIDGVPFGSRSLGAADVSANINGANTSPLNAIDPSNIESIEVLKDADATAIYGSRGANGVVLITTKRGKSGKTLVNAHVSTTLGQVTQFRDLLNTQQYLELRNEAIANDGFGAFLDNPAFDFIWPDLKTWSQTRYTDWQKELIGKTAYRNNMQVSVSGGNERTQFLMGASHLKETTVFPGTSNYKKTAINNAINHRSANQRFKLSASTSYALEDNQLPQADYTYLANTLEPNAPSLYDGNGDLNWENGTWENPLAALKREYQAKVNTLIANTTLSYSFFETLELKTNLGYNKYNMESYITYPSSAFNPSNGFNSGISSLTTNTAQRDSWIIEPQLHWHQQWQKVKLTVLLGSSFQQETTKQLVQRGTGFSSNNLILNLSAASTLEVLQDNSSAYKYMAYFGRINLNYQSKYIVNLTGRRDGSSRFGPNKKFGNFGAVGFAWIFSEEKWLKESPWLSFGKIRGSFGTTGSDNIGDYKFLGTYNTTGFDYNGTSVLEPTGVFNPNFGWESNKKLELGLDLGFFNDRLLINTIWYRNRSSNQLIGIPLAGTTGFNSLIGNFEATVENKGIELDLRTVNIQSTALKWTTTFNLTIAENKLVKFPNLESSAFASKYIIGQPLSIVHLYHALGVDPDTGLYQFEDYNEDGSINALDKQWIEDFAPKFYGGFGNTLNYQNWSLDCFFQFKKQKAYNSLAYGASAGFRGNGPVQLMDRWQETGDMAPIQRATFGRFPGAGLAGQNQSMSHEAVSDASFIRLRNISLSYNVPKPLNSTTNMTLYVQGQNIWTLTDYQGADPEQPSNAILPPLKQWTLGIQLSF